MTMTLGELIREAAGRIRAGGVDDARLTAEALWAHVLGFSRAQLLARLERVPSEPDQARVFELVARAAGGEPLAYLTGHREFLGLDFEVTADVLVPRPETELLVEQALGRLGNRPAHVIDVGTGSGIIAISIAVKDPQVRVTAIDRSPAALSVARRNAERHGVSERIRFLEQNLLDPTASLDPADLICANLPYIPGDDLADLAVSRHEPRIALDGGLDGLDLIRRLLMQSPAVLAPAGALLLEIEARQGPAVAALASMAFPDARVLVLRDLAGMDRVVSVDRRTMKEE